MLAKFTKTKLLKNNQMVRHRKQVNGT
jgi:hypothetical protein